MQGATLESVYEMEKWSINEVCEFLRRNDFEEDIIESFRVNKIKGRVLPLLEDEDMERLGLSALGDQKYLKHILRNTQLHNGTVSRYILNATVLCINILA